MRVQVGDSIQYVTKCIGIEAIEDEIWEMLGEPASYYPDHSMAAFDEEEDAYLLPMQFTVTANNTVLQVVLSAKET